MVLSGTNQCTNNFQYKINLNILKVTNHSCLKFGMVWYTPFEYHSLKSVEFVGTGPHVTWVSKQTTGIMEWMRSRRPLPVLKLKS